MLDNSGYYAFTWVMCMKIWYSACKKQAKIDFSTHQFYKKETHQCSRIYFVKQIICKIFIVW
jgi:hypothetical protein